MTDELILKVAGKQLSGWEEVSVTRSIQQIPNGFSILATEDNGSGFIQEGQACTVSLGSDLVITGYCDVVVPSISAGAHAVRVTGRGKTQDLVDCSAEWKGCQVSGSNALQIAQKLTAPYGISAKGIGDPGPAVPQFNINVGDSPAQILELICRHAAVLYYEDTAGNLVLAPVGTAKAGSGFVEGQNVEAASWVKSMGQRYSEYVCSLLSVDTSGLFETQDGLFYAKVTDPNVPRHRRLVIVAEGVTGGLELAKKRALWECARRAGRGRAVRITVDSWRDGKGALWAPNTLAPVSLPHLGLTGVTWLIAEVTYRLAKDTGRTAELLLMAPESFTPEPVKIQPLVAGVTSASGSGAP